jgi:hypothetical protein
MELVETIFFTIDPKEELSPGDPYSLFVRIVVREAKLLELVKEQRLKKLAERMSALFRECTGVTLADCAVVSDEEFTFVDMSRSLEWTSTMTSAIETRVTR